jgi:hypothetical protein
MIRTYLDSGVLILASRGDGSIAEHALNILEDPERVFVTSVFVKLEVLPKALYHRRDKEVRFYQEFFRAAECWAKPLDLIIQEAYTQAYSTGLSAIDALHVASAIIADAEELVTTEKPVKPLHRVSSIKVVGLQDS